MEVTEQQQQSAPPPPPQPVALEKLNTSEPAKAEDSAPPTPQPEASSKRERSTSNASSKVDVPVGSLSEKIRMLQEAAAAHGSSQDGTAIPLPGFRPPSRTPSMASRNSEGTTVRPLSMNRNMHVQVLPPVPARPFSLPPPGPDTMTVVRPHEERASPSPSMMSEEATEVKFAANFQTLSVVEEVIPEPAVVDSALDCPKFEPTAKTTHVQQLLALLGLDQRKMTAAQRAGYRQYLTDFSAHYLKMENYQSVVELHYNGKLVDAAFALVADNSPNLDVILSTLAILSRHSKTKGPNGGTEPRITQIIRTINTKIALMNIVREAGRTLVNFAEANAGLLSDQEGIESMSSALNRYASNEGILSAFMLLFRSLSVTDVGRKPIMDRFGFIISNCIGLNHGDLSIPENGCYVLGNLSLLPEGGTYLASSGAVQTVRNIMCSHPEDEKIQEAAGWFFFNASKDAILVKTILRSSIDEPLVAAHTRFQQKNANIKLYAEQSMRRIRDAIIASTPAAIAARYANSTIFEGYLNLQGGIFNRYNKKWFIVQPYRIVFCLTEKDPEIRGEIKLRTVKKLEVDPEDKSKLQIITQNGKVFNMQTLDNVDAQPWFQAIFKQWKMNLNPVQESAPSGDNDHAAHSPGALSSPDFIYPEDLEKNCLQIVLHEICNNPYYITRELNSQKQFPNFCLHDWFAARTTRELVNEFLMKQAQNFKCTGRDAYDAPKMRAELEALVERRFLELMLKFDENPPVEGIPEITTRFEYAAKQGIRPTMEDRHTHVPFADEYVGRGKKDDATSFYAVYDGHGGTIVAEYVETHLMTNILRHETFDTDIKKSISESFLRTQNDLAFLTDRLYLNNTAGSTAVTVLIKGKKLYASWAGDSLATLFLKNDKHVELIDPHKPGKESEKLRIENLGGFVTEEMGIPRVNGAVAVSRSFGNIRHRVIIPEADIKEVDLTGDEEFLVIACDGLWDVMNSQEVRTFVKKYMSKNGKRTAGISEALVDEALRRQSTDNVSCIFIEFNSWKGPKRG